ncbi:hypothetical protein BT93_J0732 [Corymbia citriodora subsp. variegata]|nr:hypothetical protein BT93_J0732 [Corymbia citriodora subsp. variegata]
MVDNNNWRPTPPGGVGGGGGGGGGTEAGLHGGDWRSQLLPESRERIINKIMRTLKRHLPVSGPEGLQELKKIAMRFEEKSYTAATSQVLYHVRAFCDYLVSSFCVDKGCINKLDRFVLKI